MSSIFVLYALVKLHHSILAENVIKMDFLVKTKVRGVTKLIKYDGNECSVFDFLAKGMINVVALVTKIKIRFKHFQF